MLSRQKRAIPQDLDDTTTRKGCSFGHPLILNGNGHRGETDESRMRGTIPFTISNLSREHKTGPFHLGLVIRNITLLGISFDFMGHVSMRFVRSYESSFGMSSLGLGSTKMNLLGKPVGRRAKSSQVKYINTDKHILRYAKKNRTAAKKKAFCTLDCDLCELLLRFP